MQRSSETQHVIESDLVLRVIGALSLVALLLWALACLARRFGLPAGGVARSRRLVRIIETTALPGASALHAIEIGDTCVIVARSPSQVGVLCEVRPETLAAWRASRR
jgi:flagellar biogenesis protein FliO